MNKKSVNFGPQAGGGQEGEEGEAITPVVTYYQPEMASTASSLSLISTAPSSAPSGSTDDTSNSDDTVAIAAAARY